MCQKYVFQSEDGVFKICSSSFGEGNEENCYDDYAVDHLFSELSSAG